MSHFSVFLFFYFFLPLALCHCLAQNAHSIDDPFPPDYLSELATFVASLNHSERTMFHHINNDPTTSSETMRVAQLREFVEKLPNETKIIGMALLDRMCQLDSVLPGQPFLHFAAVFLQLMGQLDEQRREKAMQMLGEQRQTDAEFEQKFVEFAHGFEKEQQKLMAIEFIKAKHSLREHFLQRLKMANLSTSAVAKKAKHELKSILLDLDMPKWEICWRLEQLDGMRLKERDRDRLRYVLTMLKMKCR